MCITPKILARRRLMRGFALVDIIMALIIFSLIVGSVCMISFSATRMCSQIGIVWSRHQQIQGLTDFLREMFRYMPSVATVKGWTDSQTYLQLRGVSSIIPNISLPVFNNSMTPPDNVSFVTKTRDDGNIDLYIVQQPDNDIAVQNPDPANGFPLFQNVSSLTWHFYNRTTQQWQDDWQDTTTRPQLIELDILFIDDSQPTKMIFWLPGEAR